MKKLTTVLASLPLALGLAIGTAQAASVSSQFFSGTINKLSDNSGEQWFDRDQSGDLSVGDTLRGTLQIGTIEDLINGGPAHVIGSPPVNQLLGIFEAEVATRTLSGPGAADFTFAPYAPFAAEFGLTGGSMVALYEVPNSAPYTRIGPIATIESTVTSGSLLFELGFGLDADEIWYALGAPLLPTVASGIPVGTAFGLFNAQLSMITNNTNRTFFQVAAGCSSVFPPPPPICASVQNLALADGMIDVNGSGQLLGTLGSTTNYDLFDNIDFVVSVPEPATMALMGIGLMGIGAASRKRRKA